MSQRIEISVQIVARVNSPKIMPRKNGRTAAYSRIPPYRIVSSFKSQPVQLQVWDRLPKGENESVGVTLLKSAPELSKDGIYLRESRPNNLLRWDVEVAPNCNGEKAVPITYEFRMELAREMAITGFLSK